MSTAPTPLQQAVAAWTQLLGAEGCISGTDARVQAYGHDIGEYARRVIAAIVYPASPVDVQAIVRVANIHHIPLYSLSIGKNWGLGSRQPVEHHSVVVDLSRMQQIRTINLDEGYAIVEPGVTQQALSDALASTAYIANFTASIPETSLVGNVLDKGIGLYRHRVDDLLGVEVVLGDGTLVHVGGYWPLGRAMFYSPSGLGPTLTPLFLQSNFGIVTACVLKLVPRPETIHILYATLAADRLAQALAVLKQLRCDHVLNTVIKLYNAHAFHKLSSCPGVHSSCSSAKEEYRRRTTKSWYSSDET
jgi:4-cresol dehydrogenase (hydroxylating) flavoprotein subunit